jgi:hypothetical protein
MCAWDLESTFVSAAIVPRFVRRQVIVVDDERDECWTLVRRLYALLCSLQVGSASILKKCCRFDVNAVSVREGKPIARMDNRYMYMQQDRPPIIVQGE